MSNEHNPDQTTVARRPAPALEGGDASVVTRQTEISDASRGSLIPSDKSAERLEPLDYILLAYDGLLAQEGVDAETPSGNLAAPFAETVERAEHCLRELEKLWPRAERRNGLSSDDANGENDKRFGPYLLLDEIARGGMGVVYRARHERLDRTVALKRILAGTLASESEIRRFQEEARAAAKLQHRGIVPIFEVGDVRGQHYFTMQLVEGPSLHERLRQGPFPPWEAAELARQIAEAVAFAHRNGIVHRDLKPHNILLDPVDGPKITDFGLAKRLDSKSFADLTATGDIVGTPHYMAPEQAAGSGGPAVEPRSDIYSLGALLYAMLTGAPPFTSAQLTVLLDQVQRTEPTPPSQRRAGIPRDLETICLKALQKRPGDRYATASEMAQDLSRFLQGEPIAARRAGVWERTARWVQRNPGHASRVALVALACILVVVGFVYRRQSLEWKRQAEMQTELVVQRSQLVVQQSQLARHSVEMANLATASRLFSDANASATRRHPGWTWQALDFLSQAESLAPSHLDPVEIGSLTAQAHGAFDVRPIAQVAQGVRIQDVAFRRDGRELAVAQHRGTPHSSVFVYRADDWQLVETVSLNTATANAVKLLEKLRKGDSGSFQEGMSCVALSDDGKWIAAGTRLGKVCVWRRGGDASPLVFDAQPDMAISRVRFADDSRTLYAVSRFRSRVYSWDLDEQTDDQRTAGESSATSAWKAARVWSKVTRNFDVHPTRPLGVTYADSLQMFDLHSDRYRTDLGNERLGPFCLWPDGRFLIAGQDHLLRVVELETGRVAKEIAGLRSPETEIDYSPPVVAPRHGVALVADESGDVSVLDVTSGELVMTLNGGGREEPPLAVSGDERWLAIAKDTGVEILELRDSRTHQVAGLTPFAIDGIAWSGRGEQLAYMARQLDDRALVRMETGIVEFASDDAIASPTFVQQVHGHPRFDRFHSRHFRSTRSLSWDAAGERLAVGSELLGLHWRLTGKDAANAPWQWPRQWRRDGPSTRRIETDSLKVLGEGSERVAIEADERAWGGTSARVNVEEKGETLRVAVPAVERPTRGEELAVVARVRARRRTLDAPVFNVRLAGREGGELLRVRMVSDEEYEWVRMGVMRAPYEGESLELEFMADPATVAQWWLDEVLLLPQSRQLDSTGQFKPSFRFVNFSPSGEHCFCVLGDDELGVWETSSGELRFSFQNRSAAVFSGNGQISSLAVGSRYFAMGDLSGNVLRWDAETFKPLALLGEASQTPVTSLAFSPSSDLLAIGTLNGSLRVVRADDGGELSKLTGATSAVTAIVFEPDGHRFWTGSRDGSVMQWQRDGDEWRLHRVLSDRGEPVKDLAFAPETGRLLVLREDDKSLHIWRVPP